MITVLKPEWIAKAGAGSRQTPSAAYRCCLNAPVVVLCAAAWASVLLIAAGLGALF